MAADFAKGWIFTALGLSVLGVGAHFVLDHFVAKARTDRSKAFDRLGQVFSLGGDIETLNNEKENDAFRVKSASDRINEYFQEQARDAGIDLAPNISKDKEETPRGAENLGFRDRAFEITFAKRSGQDKQGFPRSQIARFLFNIEAKTKLLTVSEVTLDQADMKNPTDDYWNVRAFVTERRPKKGGETAAAE